MDRDHAKIAIAAALIQVRSDDITSNEGVHRLVQDVERIVDKLLPRATGGGSVEVKHS